MTAARSAHRSVPPLLAAALGRAEAWLLEPAGERLAPRHASDPIVPAARPLIVVTGAAPACGATTVARALGAELAVRDPVRTCAVSAAANGGGLPLGTPAAARLARAVTGRTGLGARPSGRLCLIDAADPLALEQAVDGLASLVVDAGARTAPGGAASIAWATVLVAAPRVEPALAALLATSLARIGPEPLVVLNRASGGAAGGWSGRAHVELPSSAAAARFALAGRGAGGPFGRAVAELADLCEAR